MTNEELCVLARKGDINARNQLVENNKRFVYKIAWNIWSSKVGLNIALGNDIYDMKQEGMIGLLEAIEQYNEGAGASFLTYASVFVKNALFDYIRKISNCFEGRNLNNFVRMDELKQDEQRTKLIDSEIRDPKNICIKKMMYEDLHRALGRMDSRGSTYLLYRFGFTDDIDHSQAETASHFHLSLTRGKSTELEAMDNLWLELPWWF